MGILGDIDRLLEMSEEVKRMVERYRDDLACIEWDRNHPLVNAVAVLGGEWSGLRQAASWLMAVERERRT